MPSKTPSDRPRAAASKRPRARTRSRAAAPDAAAAADPAVPVADPVLIAPAPAEPAGPDAAAPAPRGRRRRAAPAAAEAAAPAEAVAAAPAAEPGAAPEPGPDPDPAPVPRSRRGVAKSRRREAPADAEPVVPPVADEVVAEAEPEAAPEAEPEAQAAPEPEAPPRRRGRSRGRRGAEAPDAPHAAQAPPAGLAPAPAGPVAEIQPPADGSLFGRYAITVPGEEPAEVTLRSAAAGTDWCSCLDFALSEDASCPHVQALRQHLQADPERAEACAAGAPQGGSRIALRQAAQRSLLWLPGRECPPALDTLATELLSAPTPDDQALPRLLRQAREAGHELQVDEAVWAQMAVQRDARWRVHRLQDLLPQGPASPALQDLATPPLLPLQVEAALFAVCAGRCILADDAVLQPERQALAAAELLRRYFGVERVLVLAPEAALDRWRRRLPADAEGWSLFALDRVAGDVALHRGLAPDLVIVVEPAEGGLWVDAERAAALLQLRSAYAVVLPGEGWLDRPAELPLRLAFVDAERTGAYAALLHQHGVRDGSGELCGLQDLDALRDTLEPVLLARRRAEVLSQLPERLDRLLPVPLPAAARGRHEALAEALRATVSRWQRVGWLPDGAQRQLVEQVQVLRRLCAGDGDADVAAAKAEAVRSVLAGPDGAEAPVAKLVVFSQWPGALQALQQQLAAAGVPSQGLLPSDPEPARRAAAQAFKADPALRVLLVADAGSGTLELQVPGAQVLHLDRPWNPRLLNRRFGRVHRRGKAHLVPVTHLLAEGSFEQRLQALTAERRDPAPDLLDAAAAEAFLQGQELAQWLADLAALLDLPPPVPAPVSAAPA